MSGGPGCHLSFLDGQAPEESSVRGPSEGFFSCYSACYRLLVFQHGHQTDVSSSNQDGKGQREVLHCGDLL